MKGGPPYTVCQSYDGTKVMINYRRKPLKKNDTKNNDLLGFFVFDQNMDPIWGREVEMPYTEAEMNNLAYTVASDGTVHMMSFYREAKDFRLINIPAKGELDVMSVGVGDFMFKDLYIKENAQDNIDFLGFYANGLDYKFWEGVWGKLGFNTNGIKLFKINKEGEVLSSSDIEFPLELINQYESARQQNTNEQREEVGNAGIRDLVLRNYTINDDGSIFILGEQYYYTQNYNPQTYQMVYTFYYEDLVATKVGANGEVLWMKKLPKRQIGSTVRGGMGIAYLEAEGSHYILFLDNEKNADIGMDEAPAKHQDKLGGFLTAYKVDDATGSYTKQNIYNSREFLGVKAQHFQTNRIVKATDNVLLVEVYIKGRKDAMIKMEVLK